MIDSAQTKWQVNKVTIIAGVIVIAGFFLCSINWWFFGWVRADRLISDAVTCLLFVGPLFASGIALVTMKQDDEIGTD